MQRRGRITVLCVVLAAGQTGYPTISAAQPDPSGPPDQPGNRMSTESIPGSIDARTKSPPVTVKPAGAPPNFVSVPTPEAPGTITLSVRGGLQTNLLYFPNARPQEPSDVLSASAFSMDAGTRGQDRFSVSARDSRFTIDARATTSAGQWRTVAEFDFFGRSPRSYDPRVRMAYLAWTQADGSWGISTGQDWSLFADPTSYAALYNPLPPGAVFVRQPQVRVTRRGASGLSLAVSIERARGDIASSGGSILGSPLEGTPDVVGSARLERPWGALQWGGLVRGGTPDRQRGWGMVTSGNLRLSPLPRSTLLRFQATYGAGIARYVGEFGSSFEREAIETARAAQIDPGNERISAANVSCEHTFTRWLSGSILGSIAHADTRDEPSRQDRSIRTVGGNVVFHPRESMDLAVEYLTVSRRDGSQSAQRRNALRLSVRVQF